MNIKLRVVLFYYNIVRVARRKLFTTILIFARNEQMLPGIPVNSEFKIIIVLILRNLINVLI